MSLTKKQKRLANTSFLEVDNRLNFEITSSGDDFKDFKFNGIEFNFDMYNLEVTCVDVNGDHKDDIIAELLTHMIQMKSEELSDTTTFMLMED